MGPTPRARATVHLTPEQLCDRLESLPIVVPPIKLDEAAAPASPLIVTVPAPRASSPPSSLLLAPMAEDGEADIKRSLDDDVQRLIQNMVRDRVARHWPLVRAFECRTSSEATVNLPLKVDKWIVFSSFNHDEALFVGKVLKLGVSPRLANLSTSTGSRPICSQWRCTREYLAPTILSNGHLRTEAHRTCTPTPYWQLRSPWSQCSSYPRYRHRI